MKAVVYRGERNVHVEDVPKPEVEAFTDGIVRVSSAAICGSDLHIYEGRTTADEGKILGHEIIGTVTELGRGVEQLKVGDRVVLPFNVACGTCYNCVRGYTNACLYIEKNGTGATYGYIDRGPYQGGQAEYVRVPFIDFAALKLPGQEHDDYEDDFLMVADAFPTAFHAATLADVRPGSSVAIIGCGPIGLLSVVAADLMGATEIYAVDYRKSRLQKAEQLGAMPIDMYAGDPEEQIIKIRRSNKLLTAALRPGESKRLNGVSSGIDAIGYQAHAQTDMTRENHGQALEYLANLILPTGSLGIAGVYLARDLGEFGPEMKGEYILPWGVLWSKGIKIGTGYVPVKRYDAQLRDLIIAGKTRPGSIVSHHVSIDEAPLMYQRFDKREEGVHKVVIRF